MPHTEPIYETAEKLEARAENVRIYRELTGRSALPRNREYWCLCSRQFRRPTAEINQMVQLLGITKRQFHGVDYSATKIKRNQILHPEAHFHVGDWMEVLDTVSWNPGLVYLDTTSQIEGKRTEEMIRFTMRKCPPDTVLLVNVMLINPYAGRRRQDPQVLLAAIADGCTAKELEQWNWKELHAFEYSSGVTPMLTIALYRGAK